MKRKLLVAAAAAFFSSPLWAQDMTYDAGKTTFGVRAGVNFQNINGKNRSGDKLENDIATGFHAGVNAEVPLGTGFYLQPGVLYSQKGTEFDNDNQVKLNYIEVPVNFVYKPILGTGRMLLGFGPYVGFGLGGKVKTASTERDVSFEKTANSSTPSLTYGVYKGMDAGANLLAGYEFARNISFQVNAQLGLVNINPEFEGASNDESKWKNTGFGVSVGYRF
jgi:opacity protein-like surface antigen